MINIIYYLSMLLFSIGIFLILNSDNYLKKIIGLVISQNSILIFFISLSKVFSKTEIIKIIDTKNIVIKINPLTQVMMLTGIVVGFCTFTVALSILKQIKKNFDSLSEHKLNKLVNDDNFD